MKRIAALLSVASLGLTSGAAFAHPDDPKSTIACPCIGVDGNGSRSVTLSLARPAVLWQQDISPYNDPSKVSGWMLQDRQGRVVAGQVLINDGTVYSHSVAEATQVKLGAGRYTLTRLTSSAHRLLIPIRGLPAQRLVATLPPRVVAGYKLSSTPAALALMRAEVESKGLLLFAEARQLQSAQLRLTTCVDNTECISEVAEPRDRLSPASVSVRMAIPLRGRAATVSTAGYGPGIATSVLQIVIARRS